MSTNFPFKHLAEEVQFGWSDRSHPCDSNADMFSPRRPRKMGAAQDRAIEKKSSWYSRTALANALDPLPLSAVYYHGKQPKHEAGHISLSHTKNGAIAAYSATLEVGVDIEGYTPTDWSYCDKNLFDRTKKHTSQSLGPLCMPSN